jgi:hypothetical protein
MTKTFTNQAAQGDMLLRRIDKLPEGLELSKDEERPGYYILAHSETGHHHVIEKTNAQLLIDKTNEFIAYLEVSEPSEIKHLREHDTHESITVPKGLYEIRRQVEYTPQGLRRAQD